MVNKRKKNEREGRGKTEQIRRLGHTGKAMKENKIREKGKKRKEPTLYSEMTKNNTWFQIIVDCAVLAFVESGYCRSLSAKRDVFLASNQCE